MSGQDPDRLSSSSEDGELRALLEEGKRELPTQAQLASLAAKLGPLGGGGGGGGGGRAHAGGATAGIGTFKGAAVLVAATTALWGGVHLYNKKPPHPPPRPRIASESPAEVLRRVLDTADASLLGDGGDEEELPPPLPPMTTATSAPPPRPKPSASAVPTPKPVLPPVSDSANELVLLKAAQDALIEDPRKALAIIDEDLRRYPSGVLRQEAEVIGIDALARMGNAGAARARADKFRAMYPGSTHVRRIDAILGRTE